MKKCVLLLLATTLAATAGESPWTTTMLDNDVLWIRARVVPDNSTEQIHTAGATNHISGTVLDLRFADGTAAPGADYFAGQKSPLVILVNSQTSAAAAALAMQLRASAAAIVIGSTNPPGTIAPDITVTASAADERKFQENPYASPVTNRPATMPATNSLLTFVDHTSEAELVRKHIKDGEEDADPALPRAESARPVICDPALARAVDLLRALAILHESRG